jgi:hypothetical protein
MIGGPARARAYCSEKSPIATRQHVRVCPQRTGTQYFFTSRGESRGNGRGGNAGVNNDIHLGIEAAVTNVTITGYRRRGNAGGIFLGAFASDYIIISSCNNQGNAHATLVNHSSARTTPLAPARTSDH